MNSSELSQLVGAATVCGVSIAMLIALKLIGDDRVNRFFDWFYASVQDLVERMSSWFRRSR
jgi:hypothetical protein